MNGDHGIHEDEVKRSRAQYNGEQIYSNLSPNASGVRICSWAANLSVDPQMWAKWTKQDELKASMADLPTSNGSPYHHLTSQASQPAPPSQGGAFEQAFSPVVSSAEKQPAEYDVAMTTINSQSTAVYSPPLGSNSLTPLTPISMQEVKSLVNSGASLIETSPNPHSYHPGESARISSRLRRCLSSCSSELCPKKRPEARADQLNSEWHGPYVHSLACLVSSPKALCLSLSLRRRPARCPPLPPPAAAATGSEIQGSPSPAKAEAPCPLSSLTVLQPVQGAIPGYGSSFSQFSAAPGKCLAELMVALYTDDPLGTWKEECCLAHLRSHPSRTRMH
ncbi:hypothetical protein HPB50_027225 [Hyalomma asiaticum]|uniref:Uncharacterized protein n=1 Tax=Hyalomma asiaticum TaxID=266040 RepID=A0ACB7TS03_HYAAI|nr:hypothetical protein HPB50_027225 [Hyalomma asiaticum]